jgi:hypothetical protein
MFLETYPLYRTLQAEVPDTVDKIPQPAINDMCIICGSHQTFRQANRWSELTEYANTPSAGLTLRAMYLCSGCQAFQMVFLLRIGNECDWVMKIGQWPAWSTQMDPGLKKLLGEHSLNYKRALVCESQSYGIGAFAYYRRIVEEIIDRLLGDIADLIPDDEQSDYAAALKKANQTTVTQDKIALVKDLLPWSLRPDGMNPLSVLHSTLSEGLHGRSDEQCLEDAETIRRVLVFLVNQVLEANKSAQEFTSSMRKLLDQKSKRPSPKNAT